MRYSTASKSTSRPFRFAQLTRPDEHQRSKEQSAARHERALIRAKVAKQLADGPGVRDRRVMSGSNGGRAPLRLRMDRARRDQSQSRSGTLGRSPVRSVRGFVVATLLDLADDLVCVAGHPARREFREPLTRDRFEAVCVAAGGFCGLLVRAWIDSAGEDAARFVALLARHGQRRSGWVPRERSFSLPLSR